MRGAAQTRGLTKEQRAQIRLWAKAGDANSQFLLACGDRLEKSRDRWLRLAAENAHPEACYDYYFETGDPAWLELSVASGWAQAQQTLASMLAVGEEGFEQDFKRSRALYLEASLQGHESAWYDTGFMILLGEGGPADPEEALDWLAKAATSKAGNAADAARLLAELYEQGLHGVPQDLIRAEFWKQNFQAWQEAFLVEGLAEHLHERGLEGFPEIESPAVLGQVLAEYMGGSPTVEIVRELLKRGADPNIGLPEDDTFAGSTSLSWSVSNLEIVKLLVDSGARVTFECRQRHIISVHEACDRGKLDVLRYLVDHAEGAAALDHYDNLLRTPLICAAGEGHLPIVNYLIDLGVDVGAHRDESALEAALSNGHTEVAERLRTTV